MHIGKKPSDVLILILLTCLVSVGFGGGFIIGRACSDHSQTTRVETRYRILHDTDTQTIVQEHYIAYNAADPTAEYPAPNVVYADSATDATNAGSYKLTAYCPCEKCCGAYANGITATGVVATPNRTIAVDPNKIPYGTHVIINGQEYVAEDCGGGVRGNHIDIFFATHEEAIQFGVQYADVYIMEVNDGES